MRRPSKLKKWFWILLIVGGSIGGYFIYQKTTVKEDTSSEYQKISPKIGDISLTILTTGVVTPQNRLDIKPPIPGRIDQILVDEGDQVKTNQVLAYMSSTERAGLLDSARSKGPAEVLEWEKLFKPTPILAPISGTIIKRRVVPGQTFGTGDAVYTMSDRLVVNAQVDETDIGQVALLQHTVITLDAYPKVHVEGTVSKIAFDATTVNNVTTYDVEVTPSEIPKEMLSGMTANIAFDVEHKSNVLLIPQGAIKVKNGKSYVKFPAAQKDQAPIETEIETGISDGKNVEVVKGLKATDILLAPAFKLEGEISENPFSPFGGRTQRKKPSS